MPYSSLAVGLIISLVASPLLAQQDETPLVLRSTTKLVQVSVIVRDKKGQPIADLRKEDFALTDNGKPRDISVFSLQSSSALAKPDLKLPPNVFTNSLQQRSGTPASVTVILLDNLNTNWQDQRLARQGVIQFLKQIHPDDRIAIYTLGRGLRVLHDYTTDSTELLRRLESFKGEHLPDLAASEQTSFGNNPGEIQAIDNWLRGGGASQAEADFYTRNRVLGTLHALEFIADHLASVPGRKNLVWVSGGFPLQIGFELPNGDESLTARNPVRMQETFGDEMDRTVRSLNNANLAIYPVDARGLIVDPAFNAENSRVNLSDTNRMNHVYDNQATMQEIASRTGGKAFYNTNDIRRAVRDAVEDGKVTYTLGFYPAEEKYDGKFHKLGVKVKRPGVDVRFRKGYVDTKEKPLDEKVRQAELRDSVWSPLDATAIGVSIVIKPDAEKNQLMVALQIDGRNISLEPSGDRHNGKLDLLFIQKDNQGHQFNGLNDNLEMRLSDNNYRKVMTNGMFYQKMLDRHPQATQLRVVVRDAASGSMGSITVPFRQLVAADKMLLPRPPVDQKQP